MSNLPVRFVPHWDNNPKIDARRCRGKVVLVQWVGWPFIGKGLFGEAEDNDDTSTTKKAIRRFRERRDATDMEHRGVARRRYRRGGDQRGA